ncbi:hypothetical protein [Paenibacillus durus]|uniref:Uncharacterized protein n=1 Tax=Paenibacillus durus ATCC 35681 TaxID=1333534 RepID=A0A0F7FBL9_PAEDU|nr:hypothetical protein [Paenibacillus durus]AKG35640.1 hypothetical protein VK70_14525 [Paenibacillus durus ATCC 35681]
MTLLLASLGEDLAVLAADTAISTMIDGKWYRAADDYRKLHVVGDDLVFLSGDVNLSEWTIQKYKQSEAKGPKELRRLMRQEYDKYCRIRPGFAERDDCIGLLAFLCAMEGGKPVGYLIDSAKNFEIERCQAPENDSVTVAAGINDEVAGAFLKEAYARGVGAVQAYGYVFDRLAGEQIGGNADVYLMDRNGIRIIHSQTIAEPPLNRVGPEYTVFSKELDERVRTLMLSAIITGSHINVGNGTFTVDGSTGHMRTTSGEFSGSITASTVTGSTIQTATSTRRIILDPNGLRSFDGNGTRRISIDTNDGFGTQELRFYGATGGKSGVVSGSDGRLNVAASSGLLVLAGPTVVLGGEANVEDFPITHTIAVGSDVSTFDFNGVQVVNLSALDSLQSEVSTLSSSISGKAERSESGYNLAFDLTTRNLKMYSRTGALLATVNIPA